MNSFIAFFVVDWERIRAPDLYKIQFQLSSLEQLHKESQLNNTECLYMHLIAHGIVVLVNNNCV